MQAVRQGKEMKKMSEILKKQAVTDEIKEAMKELGYRDGTRVEIKSAGFDRYELYVDGKTFGIWDSQKKTFVD